MFIKVEDSSVASPNQERVKRPTFVSVWFRYVHLLFILGGIYPGVRDTSNRRKWSWFKKTYTGTVVIIYLGQASSFCFAIYNRVVDGENLTRLTTFFMIMIANVLISFSASLTLPTRLSRLEGMIQLYEGRFGLKINPERWLTGIRVAVALMITNAIVSTSLLLYILGNFPALERDVYPIHEVHRFGKYFMILFSGFFNISTTAQWQGYFAVCVLLSLFLLQEFKHLNLQFKELDTATSGHVERRLDVLVDHHEILVDILNAANDCSCHFSFIGLFFSFPVNCSFIYSTLSKSASSVDSIFVYFCVLMAFAYVSIRLFAEACVNTQAHGPLQYVWKFGKKVVSTRKINRLNLFVTRLTSGSIGFSIYGLLTINMPTLLGILGTCATYFIVVFQFRPTDMSSQCVLLLKNATYY